MIGKTVYFLAGDQVRTGSIIACSNDGGAAVRICPHDGRPPSGHTLGGSDTRWTVMANTDINTPDCWTARDHGIIGLGPEPVRFHLSALGPKRDRIRALRAEVSQHQDFIQERKAEIIRLTAEVGEQDTASTVT